MEEIGTDSEVVVQPSSLSQPSAKVPEVHGENGGPLKTLTPIKEDVVNRMKFGQWPSDSSLSVTVHVDRKYEAVIVLLPHTLAKVHQDQHQADLLKNLSEGARQKIKFGTMKEKKFLASTVRYNGANRGTCSAVMKVKDQFYLVTCQHIFGTQNGFAGRNNGVIELIHNDQIMDTSNEAIGILDQALEVPGVGQGVQCSIDEYIDVALVGTGQVNPNELGAVVCLLDEYSLPAVNKHVCKYNGADGPVYVTKLGVASRATPGVITDSAAFVKENQSIGRVIMVGHTGSQKFAIEGDSGAMVVSELLDTDIYQRDRDRGIQGPVIGEGKKIAFGLLSAIQEVEIEGHQETKYYVTNMAACQQALLQANLV